MANPKYRLDHVVNIIQKQTVLSSLVWTDYFSRDIDYKHSSCEPTTNPARPVKFHKIDRLFTPIEAGNYIRKVIKEYVSPTFQQTIHYFREVLCVV